MYFKSYLSTDFLITHSVYNQTSPLFVFVNCTMKFCKLQNQLRSFEVQNLLLYTQIFSFLFIFVAQKSKIEQITIHSYVVILFTLYLYMYMYIWWHLMLKVNSVFCL
jgi:hypothetical protein